MFGRIVIRILIAVVIVALLAGGAFALYQLGVAQGYQAGLHNAANPAAVPAMPNGEGMRWGYHWPMMGFPFFSLWGCIIPILGIFFLIWLVSMPFRMMRRRMLWHHMAGSPEEWAKEREEWFSHMHRHWHGRHWPTPPEGKPEKDDSTEKA